MANLRLKNVIVSAFFGALGPYFNKQTSLSMDQSRWVVRQFTAWEKPWLLIPYDILCFFLMLWANTISVKYKMLSYKHDGAFIGTTLIFVLGYIFSSGFDYLYEEVILPPNRICGALLVVFGVMLISMQEKENKVRKHTQSIYEVVGGIPTDPNYDGTDDERKYDNAGYQRVNDRTTEEPFGMLIDRSKMPVGSQSALFVPEATSNHEPPSLPLQISPEVKTSFKESLPPVDNNLGLAEEEVIGLQTEYIVDGYTLQPPKVEI